MVFHCNINWTLSNVYKPVKNSGIKKFWGKFCNTLLD